MLALCNKILFLFCNTTSWVTRYLSNAFGALSVFSEVRGICGWSGCALHNSKGRSLWVLEPCSLVPLIGAQQTIMQRK